MVWGLVGSIGASVLSGLFNASSAKDASQQSYENSLKLQQYQNAYTTKMSNTAHQRQVEDLRKAGLNPILSATGGQGASTPSAGSATVGGFDAHLGDSVASALDFLRYKNEKELKDSTKDVNASTIRLNDSNAAKADADASSARATADYITTQNNQLDLFGPLKAMAELDNIANEIETRTAASAAQVDNIRQQTHNLKEKLSAELENLNSDSWRNRHQALGFHDSWSESDSTSDGDNRGAVNFKFGPLSSNIPSKGSNRSKSYSRSRSRTW